MKRKLFIGLACVACIASAFARDYHPVSLGCVPFQENTNGAVEKISVINDTIFAMVGDRVMSRPVCETGEWETYGFEGVELKNFVKDDNRMLAYNGYWTGDGRMEPLVFYNFLYYSEDYGKTYTEIHPKIDGKDLADFPECRVMYISSLNDSGRLIMEVFLYDFEAYRGNEFCVSDDFGQTWTTLPITMTEKHIMRTSPNANVFAVTGVESEGWRKNCIEVTPDGGKTWNKTVFEISADFHQNLEFNPEDVNEIFVIFERAKKIGHSTDCGKTWDVQEWDETYATLRELNAPDDYFGYKIDEVFYMTGHKIDRDENQTYRSIMASMDGGITWTDVYRESLPELNHEFVYILWGEYGKYILFYSEFDYQFYLFETTVVQELAAEYASVPSAIVDNNAWCREGNILSCNIAVDGIKIFDVSGRCVASTADNSIDLSNLSSGIYMALTTDENGKNLSIKFIR